MIKKVFYEVHDNLLRFYYTYIYKNKSILQMIGAEAFYEEYIKISLITFFSHRFEEIARTYFSLKVKNRLLIGITNIGTYYYDDSLTKTNGEFDVVLQKNNSYLIYEVKYYSEKLQLKEIKKESEQIKSLKGLNVEKIGFIATPGYEINSKEFDCINIDGLYNL